VQAQPMKPTLKAPGSMHLKLKYDESPSKFAFKFNLRRYTECLRDRSNSTRREFSDFSSLAHLSAMVGWCRLTLSNPR